MERCLHIALVHELTVVNLHPVGKKAGEGFSPKNSTSQLEIGVRKAQGS